MIDVNEWVADISSKAHIDIYKIKPDSDFVNCVSLRESLLYALKYKVHYSCYDTSDYEERQLCKILNGLVGSEFWIATPTGSVMQDLDKLDRDRDNGCI